MTCSASDNEVYDSTEEDMTYDEKRDLISDIVKESDLKMMDFIRVIEERQPRAMVQTASGDVEIDFDRLHASTLRAMEAKLKEYQATLEERPLNLRGIHKLSGEALEAKIAAMESYLFKLDQDLDYTDKGDMSREEKKIHALLKKSCLNPEACRTIQDLLKKYSVNPTEGLSGYMAPLALTNSSDNDSSSDMTTYSGDDSNTSSSSEVVSDLT